MKNRKWGKPVWFVGLILMLSLCVAPVAALAQAVVFGPPQDVRLTRSANKNLLQWQSVEDATSYQVYTSSSPKGTFKLLGTTKQPTYTAKNAPKASFYKVRALDGKTKSAFSDIVGSVAGATNVNGVIDGNAVKLSWKMAKHATGITLERADSKTGPWTTVEAGIQSEAHSVTLESLAPCYFRLSSEYNGMASGVSAVFSVYEPISSVRVICEESYTNGPTNKLNVTWNASVGATAYEVYRASLPARTYQLIGTTENTFFADQRHPTVPYAYKVRPMYGDVAGNESEESTLWSNMPANVPARVGATSKNGIVLVVNKKGQIVTAYTQDEQGAYTVVLRHMICSTGKVYERTPEGDFTINSKKGEWYRYPSGVYIRYPSIYTNGLFFHSVLYSSSKSVMNSTVRALGTRQSLGCIRLKVNDAKWVYEYCTDGTKVNILDGKSLPALKNALKPKTVKVK